MATKNRYLTLNDIIEFDSSVLPPGEAIMSLEDQEVYVPPGSHWIFISKDHYQELLDGQVAAYFMLPEFGEEEED